VPVVNVSGHSSPAGVPHVDLDNGAVCDLAIDHFVQRGFRHFAYAGNSRFQWSHWRCEQFVSRITALRATCGVLECDDSAQDRKRLRAWLQALPKPVGILACNDVRGRTILEACEESGLAVPQEVAVLGVDNDEILCTLCRPQLSSVVPDPGAIGYLAAQTLHEMLQGRNLGTLQRWVCPLDVCSRQSTDASAVSDWHVSQALRIIHAQAARGLCVDDVVARTRTSRRFLEERFRAVVGRPIHAEIARVRFETAQRLLTTTALPLKDVASRAGFRRADYLSAVFREQLGMSPSEYRNGYSSRARSAVPAGGSCKG
jgi:LacI family transcriptional regulator